MNFCDYCGRKLKEHERCSCPESIHEHYVARKKAIQIGIIVIGVVILAIIILIGVIRHESPNTQSDEPETAVLTETAEDTVRDPVSGTTGPGAGETNAEATESITSAPREKIDPTDYLNEPVFEGFNGEGVATITLDYGRLVNALVSDDYAKHDFYNDLVSKIKVDISTETGLNNGDEIKVSITVPDALRDEVKNNSEAKYAVFGLTELREMDLLSLFEVKPDGISGEAKLNITENNYLTIDDFDVTPGTTNLSNGDVVTMTLKETAVQRLATEHHIKPLNTKLTHTVQDLNEYVMSADQLPMDVVTEIAAQYLAVIEANFDGGGMLTAKSFKLEGIYLVINQKPHISDNLRLVVEVSYIQYDTWGDSKTIRRCWAVTEEKLIVQPGEIASLSYESGSETPYTIENLNEYYEITKIG